MLKTLRPQPVEAGKIKIGGKGAEKQGKNGTYNLPVKYDGFIITKLNKSNANFDIDVEAMRILGGVDEKTGNITALTRLPIKFTFDDIEQYFSTRMACYVGKSCVCSGDGETAVVKQTGATIACSCEKSSPDYTGKDKCKPNGKLSVKIEGVTPLGKTHVFRTTGWNSIQSIMNSLYNLTSETWGRLRGPVFWLTYDKKTTVDVNGRTQHVPVIGLEYTGNEEELRRAIIANAETEAKFTLEMKKLKHLAVQFSTDPIIGLDEIEEYYPENASLPEPKETPAIENKTGVEDKTKIENNVNVPTQFTETEEIVETVTEVTETEVATGETETTTETKTANPTREDLIKTLCQYGWTEAQLKGRKVPGLKKLLEDGVLPPEDKTPEDEPVVEDEPVQEQPTPEPEQEKTSTPEENNSAPDDDIPDFVPAQDNDNDNENLEDMYANI